MGLLTPLAVNVKFATNEHQYQERKKLMSTHVRQQYVNVEIQCKMCRKVYSIDLPILGYFAWELGSYVQDAFPDMPASLRELLISKICSTCFDKLCGDDDDT